MENILRDIRLKIIEQNSDFLKSRSYVEFGVFRGESMSQIYDLYEEYIKDGVYKFYGFDSFEGLPKETIDENNPSYWPEGEFYLSNEQKNTVFERLNKPRIKLIDGWFCNTLTDSLADEMKDQKIGILHIDCDLYSSTYEALDFCFKNNFLERGSIIIYDDWAGYHEKLGEGHEFECGEGLAHKQIMEKYNRKALFKDKHIISKDAHEVAVFILE